MRRKIIELFESNTISRQPRLAKRELSDQQFVRVLAAAPGDINIILARAESLINGHETKSKKQLTHDILEVLERSEAARLFMGVGLKDEYHLFRGFPVRLGEKFADIPDQGSEIKLDQQVFYQVWTTDPTTGRKIATTYDPAKGEPLGGLLVDTHVSSNALYHDVNAIIRTCKIKLNTIRNYNLNSAQGKAISNKNTDFLATETSAYHDIYEILTPPGVVHVKVTDNWHWDAQGDKRVPKWKTVNDANKEKEVEQQPDPQMNGGMDAN